MLKTYCIAVKIIITEDMIGHKFGEFSMTRGKFSYKKKKKKSKCVI